MRLEFKITKAEEKEFLKRFKGEICFAIREKQNFKYPFIQMLHEAPAIYYVVWWSVALWPLLHWEPLGRSNYIFIGLFIIFFALVAKVLLKNLEPSPSLVHQKHTYGKIGIVIQTEESDVKIGWQEIGKCHETENLTILAMDQRQALVIPKRAFRNKKEKETFQKICKENIFNTA